MLNYFEVFTSLFPADNKLIIGVTVHFKNEFDDSKTPIIDILTRSNIE